MAPDNITQHEAGLENARLTNSKATDNTRANLYDASRAQAQQFYQNFCADIHAHNSAISPSANPIGVFDSGVGGLSILHHLCHVLPDQQFIYLADTKHVPYGSRAPENIQQLTHASAQWLYDQGCRLMVVACNSASAYSLESLRAHFTDMQFVGLVPALKPAISHTQSKKVAVLATQATLNGNLLNSIIEDFAMPAHVQVCKIHEPILVPWVEAGMPLDNKGFERLQEIINQLTMLQVDCLVLGCTHYPFFEHIVNIIAPELTTIDSGYAIAQRVKSLLEQNEQQHNTEQKSQAGNITEQTQFFSTADMPNLAKLLEILT